MKRTFEIHKIFTFYLFTVSMNYSYCIKQLIHHCEFHFLVCMIKVQNCLLCALTNVNFRYIDLFLFNCELSFIASEYM